MVQTIAADPSDPSIFTLSVEISSVNTTSITCTASEVAALVAEAEFLEAAVEEIGNALSIVLDIIAGRQENSDLTFKYFLCRGFFRGIQLSNPQSRKYSRFYKFLHLNLTYLLIFVQVHLLEELAELLIA